MRARVDKGLCGQPLEGVLVLGDDKREQREFERVGQALQDAEVVLADVGILRCVGDKTALGQAAGVAVVGGVVDGRVGHVLGAALQTVLADDEGGDARFV